MSKRGENIRKRKDGRWEARYIAERRIDNKAVYRSVYGKTYAEVKEKMQIEKFCKKKLSDGQREPVSFRTVLENWLKNNKICYKPSTHTKYKYIIEKHIVPELGNIEVSALNAVIINSFLDRKLKNGDLHNRKSLSPSYVRTMALIIRSALNYAISEGMCLSLKSEIHKPAVKKTVVSTLNHKDYDDLSMYCMKHLTSTNIGILISLNTGLRIGEICALRWSDIDMANHLLYVNNTISRIQDEANKCKWIIESPKTISSFRVIPISEKLTANLLHVRGFSCSEYVASERDGFVNPRTFEYRFHKALHACEVSDINFHGLRHTFATRCVEGGMDIKTLSEILGHSNASITLNTYVHSSLERKKAQIEKVEKFFKEGQD